MSFLGFVANLFYAYFFGYRMNLAGSSDFTIFWMIREIKFHYTLANAV